MPPDPVRSPAPAEIPRAVPLGPRRFRWAWLVPIAALVFAALLAREALARRGPHVRVVAREGHGLQVGDALRYKGIAVGEVRAIELAPDLESLWIDVELDPRARGLARSGTRFWIVRPHLALDEVSGLETVIGARYLAVLPGPEDASAQREFVALEEPPLAAGLAPGGLEVQLAAPERYGIRAGAPIVYRGIQVGTILSVALASDASQVDLRAYVEPEYAALVRANTRFWEWGGLEAGVGWTGGFRLEIESLRSMLVGGVAFATPDEPGEPVGTGHRFELHTRPEAEWLEWKPRLPVGSELLPRGAALPRPLRVTRRWKGGILVLGRERSRSAWGVLLDDGLVGPEEIVAAGENESEREDALVLELAGARVEPPAPLAREGGLARVAVALEGATAWPRDQVRERVAGEDVVLAADPGAAPMPVDGAHVAEDGALDGSLALDESWNGAATVARSDGKLVGIVLVDDDGARVVRVP